MQLKKITIRIDKSLVAKAYEKLCRITSITFRRSKSHSSMLVEIIEYVATAVCYPKKEKEKIRATALRMESSSSTISFSLDEETLNYIVNLYTDKEARGISRTNAIKCCIAEILQMSESSPRKIYYYLPWAGHKTGDTLIWVTNAIKHICKTYHIANYVEPFTGSANVLIHLDCNHKLNCYINDRDKDIVNFLRVLKVHYLALCKEVRSIPVNMESFKTNSNDLNDSFSCTKNTKKAIQRAASFAFCHILSYFNNPKCFDNRKTENTLRKKLSYIITVYDKLQDVKISNQECFQFLKALLKKADLQNYLLYFDPPYIGTGKYYGHNASSFHEHLKSVIDALVDKGAKVLISYRATVTSKNKCMTTEDVQNELDRLYGNGKFYIAFRKANNRTKNQIEVLISNVSFPGSYPYNIDLKTLLSQKGF